MAAGEAEDRIPEAQGPSLHFFLPALKWQASRTWFLTLLILCAPSHIHPPEGVPLWRAEGKLGNPPISGQGAEATPRGLSTAASTGLDQANFRIWVFGGGSRFGGGSPCFWPGGPGLRVSLPSSSAAAVRRNRQRGAASEAPHETLMPGHHTAISWHLGPEPQPQSPAAVRMSGCRAVHGQCQFLTLRVDPNGPTHRTGVPSHCTRSGRLSLGALGKQEPVLPAT